MENLTPENTALLVVDMQNIEEGKFDQFKWRALVNAVERLREVAMEVRMPIVHIFFSTDLQQHVGPFQYDGMDDPFVLSDSDVYPQSLSYNDHIVDACFPKPGEFLFGKNESDAFGEGDFLAEIKDEQGGDLKNLILSGVMLQDCVISTARGALRHGYQPIIAPEATGMTTGGEGKWLEKNGKNIQTASIHTLLQQMRKTRQNISNTLEEITLW